MAAKDACLAVENVQQQLEQAPALVQETHKMKPLRTGLRTMSLLLKELDGEEYEPDVAEWLQRVRDVAYKAQDVVGSIVVEANHQNQRSKLRRWLSRERATKNHAGEIDNIGKRIEEICSFKVGGSKKEFNYSPSFKIEDIVGFEDAKEKLVTKLIGDAGSGRRKVMLIFGEAGAGKTTLARMVFSDHRIEEHFRCREWFSQALSPEEILCRLLKHNSSPEKQTDCLLTGELKAENIKQNRYLIIIDNVPNIDVLDELMSSLPDELNGSRILLASRADLNVQQSVSFSYKIKPLDVDHSWKLLSKKVLDGENHQDLEKLGIRMAEKCKGLPRAIVAMAALLNHVDKSVEMWSEFLKFDDPIPEYDELPRELKLCLLYFGHFPAILPIPAKQMVQMWMAEGLVKQNGSMRAEELGEHYMKKLKNQSFIKEGTKRSDGSVKTFYIFNYISRLCVSKGETEKFFKVYMGNNNKPQKNIKRMAIHSNLLADLKSFGDCSHAHSLHGFREKTENTTIIQSVDDFWETLVNNFRNLRVLNLGFLELDKHKVPKELGKLVHLKYLRLRAPTVKQLPSSIVNLQQLETLDMRESEYLVSLPQGIWKMKYLRNLYLGGSAILPKPLRIDYYKSLPDLQTLSGVCPDKVLKKLMVRAKFPSVKKLRICSSDLDLTCNFLNSLDHLYHLQSLRIEKPTKLPDLDAFPLSLTKLTLLKTKLPSESIKTLEKIPSLRILKLLEEAICGEEVKCSAGGFLRLEFLTIENLAVKMWIQEGAMRYVKCFFVKESTLNWETIPDYLRKKVECRN
ncbi:hypothetical protein BVRB_1g023350 [Beta vulgaris subsp. vulgaris]|uniref:NB-ARC domain-containing protein n=1 Tax=Beta vulgaris subsp. vulgaris TaxID=3555 RepID=A0A0J8E8N9_BETVV|nr:disease resistance protein RPP8-like [Beta vulgaris subsp. vulgaris]KMS99495.1 hypothetical protein BVRB_1g023350 [Beta vulgaris subsp. vulgaris]